MISESELDEAKGRLFDTLETHRATIADVVRNTTKPGIYKHEIEGAGAILIVDFGATSTPRKHLDRHEVWMVTHGRAYFTRGGALENQTDVQPDGSRNKNELRGSHINGGEWVGLSRYQVFPVESRIAHQHESGLSTEPVGMLVTPISLAVPAGGGGNLSRGRLF